MSDIFISYSSEDRDRILPLVNALEKTGWSVFWNKTTPSGDARAQLIKACRTVVVIWTKNSVTDHSVHEEAEIGRSKGILIPVLLDEIQAPVGFRAIQAADLMSWNGDSLSPGFSRLIGDITAIRRQEERERLREEERQRSLEEAKRKAQENNRRRIDEERNRAGKVFFSYARADSEFVLKLAEDLRSNGTNLWLDQLDIPGGVRWDDAVEEALHASPCLLVVLSPASVASDNVKDEISFGFDNRKTIVPVLYKDCAIPFRLRRLQYIDFRVGYEDSFKRLVQTLKPVNQLSIGNIYISFRREDSGGYALAISKKLVQYFSESQVYLDLDPTFLGLGVDRGIEEAVSKWDVLIVVIGKEWANVAGPSGIRRLDDPKDLVRLEISAALARGIHVIPVLVGGAKMPSAEILPAPLKSLTRRNPIEISHTRLDSDLERLVIAVRRALGEGVAKPQVDEQNPKQDGRSLRRTYGAVSAALVLIIFSFVFWWPKPHELPIKEDEGQKGSVKQAPMVEAQPPPKEIAPLAPEQKPEAQKEVPFQLPPIEQKQEKPGVRQPVLSAGKVFRDDLKNGQKGPEMVVIPAGSFKMGDVQGGGTEHELPVRTVRIGTPFAIGRYEVTFNEYEQFATATNRPLPNQEGRDRGGHPVINVSWQDADEYLKWLSEQTRKRYRLPTEAEWEYAARGRKETAYWWGKDLVKGMANCDGCGSQWDGKGTAPVGSFKPNLFGLYDAAGNVWEWVEDCWHANYTGAPPDGSAWKEAGGGDCGQRVRRGGSWSSGPEILRLFYRGRSDVDFRFVGLGFRLARDLD